MLRSIRDWRSFIGQLHYVNREDRIKLFIYSAIGREHLTLITIGSERILLRTATSDFSVAVRCLSGKEYGNIDVENPLVIVDAGANIGASSIFFSRSYPHAKIFAIEPEKGNYDILTINTSSYANIIPLRAALWHKTQIKPIMDRGTGPWGYSISAGPSTGRAIGQKVQAITVQELMKKHSLEYIDILKLDIEGAEKEVFENSVDWIDKVKVIIVELHDRISMGCDRAFYLATHSFKRFQKNGENVIAYRY